MNPYQNLWGDNEIGKGTKIGAFVDIGNAEIGKNCKIQAFVSICPGVTIEDNVFIGPHVCFTNVKYPPLPKNKLGQYEKTLVKKGASIGACSVILPGVTIGRKARVGAGSIVTKDIPDGETWLGVAARRKNENSI